MLSAIRKTILGLLDWIKELVQARMKWNIFYHRLLKAKGIIQSMSRKATRLDNAVAENFFGLLKTELFYLEKVTFIDQFEKTIVEYIFYYNNPRIKLKLNGLIPVQYRIQTVQIT